MKHTLKIITLTIFMSLFLQNSYAQQNENGWYWLNSQPQGNDLNWVKIIDATHYFAVGNLGTFMRSTDAGDSWFINTKAGQPEPFSGSGGSIDLNTAWFFDANTGLVAGKTIDDAGPGKIKRTTDAGNTFTSIGIGNAPGYSNILDMYFINANTGFLCGNENVSARKTTNGGLNWTSLTNVPVLVYESIYAFDENNIYLGTTTDGVSRDIIKSTNGGSTWTTITLPGTTGLTINDIVFQNANTGYVAAGPTYFAFTTNGGNNWTQAVFPFSNQDLYEMQIIGSTVYVLGSNTQYFYTSDLGVTWGTVNFNDPSNLNQPYTFIVNSFSINGSDAIVVGFNGKVNVSNDGGGSWRNKNYSVGNNEYSFKSVFGLPGTGHVWSGSEFGGLILHSTNSGANWTKQQTSASYSFEDIEMLNTSTGYAVGGDPFFGAIGYCYKTTNSGALWVKQTSMPAPTNPRFSLDFVDVNTGWTFGGYPSGGGAAISKTTNGGATWTSQVTTPSYTSTITDGEMFDANTGYIVSGGFVFKTTNGGSSWIQTNSLPDFLNLSHVNVFSSTTLYVGGDQKVYKSSNSGTTWTSVNIPSSLAGIFNMDWNDMNNGTVVGTQGYSAKTSDGGLNWVERNTGSSTLTGVSMVGNDTVFASCDRNVYGAIFRLADPNPNITLNLTVGIEGFWNGSTQVSDTVNISLMNSVSPFNEIESVSALLNTNGEGTFSFSSTPSGNYYIKITHRNSLETWSAAPVALTTGGTLIYNFTSSAAQAYGNNTTLKSSRYCDYSGDVTQEGSVDLSDVVNVNNASALFTTGYVVQDVTGDNLVDLSDLIITSNNSSLFVVKITP